MKLLIVLIAAIFLASCSDKEKKTAKAPHKPGTQVVEVTKEKPAASKEKEKAPKPVPEKPKNKFLRKGSFPDLRTTDFLGKEDKKVYLLDEGSVDDIVARINDAEEIFTGISRDKTRNRAIYFNHDVGLLNRLWGGSFSYKLTSSSGRDYTEKLMKTSRRPGVYKSSSDLNLRNLFWKKLPANFFGMTELSEKLANIELDINLFIPEKLTVQRVKQGQEDPKIRFDGKWTHVYKNEGDSLVFIAGYRDGKFVRYFRSYGVRDEKLQYDYYKLYTFELCDEFIIIRGQGGTIRNVKLSLDADKLTKSVAWGEAISDKIANIYTERQNIKYNDGDKLKTATFSINGNRPTVHIGTYSYPFAHQNSAFQVGKDGLISSIKKFPYKTGNSNVVLGAFGSVGLPGSRWYIGKAAVVEKKDGWQKVTIDHATVEIKIDRNIVYYRNLSEESISIHPADENGILLLTAYSSERTSKNEKNAKFIPCRGQVGKVTVVVRFKMEGDRYIPFELKQPGLDESVYQKCKQMVTDVNNLCKAFSKLKESTLKDSVQCDSFYALGMIKIPDGREELDIDPNIFLADYWSAKKFKYKPKPYLGYYIQSFARQDDRPFDTRKKVIGTDKQGRKFPMIIYDKPMGLIAHPLDKDKPTIYMRFDTHSIKLGKTPDKRPVFKEDPENVTYWYEIEGL